MYRLPLSLLTSWGKKLHTETMTKRLMMRLKPSGKKEHILGCLKGENTRLQEK